MTNLLMLFREMIAASYFFHAGLVLPEGGAVS
jgi:hypothetical protein